MQNVRSILAAGLALLLAVPPGQAANHREAPITALDRAADITDVYAFVSYRPGQAPNTAPEKVTLMFGVDPLLEPANGPHYFPFDSGILYEIKVDNNNDAVEDVIFQFQFTTEERLPGPKCQSEDDILAYARETGTTIFHPTSTCRMGSDPRAVVDERLRVRGIEGLRVADGAIMPTVVSGNTNAAIVMIGEKGADMILQDARAPRAAHAA